MSLVGKWGGGVLRKTLATKNLIQNISQRKATKEHSLQKRWQTTASILTVQLNFSEFPEAPAGEPGYSQLLHVQRGQVLSADTAQGLNTTKNAKNFIFFTFVLANAFC